MRRSLLFSVNAGDLFSATAKRSDEGRHALKASQPAEAAFRLEDARGDPALHHAAIAPPLHVASDATDAAVQVLDRVRRSEGPFESEGQLHVDFGISVDVAHRTAGDEPPRSLAGTPSYMAPEQLFGSARLDHRADQFSLAAMAYELLSGKKAFFEGGFRTLAALVGAVLAPISKVAPHVPPALDAVLMRATSLRPEDRYEDMVAFSIALRDAMDEEATAPCSLPPTSQVRRVARSIARGESSMEMGCSLCA